MNGILSKRNFDFFGMKLVVVVYSSEMTDTVLCIENFVDDIGIFVYAMYSVFAACENTPISSAK